MRKVVAVVTDNASNMLAARKLLVNRDGLGHIIPMRCWMHAFALVMASVAAHKFARGVISDAQRVVTYFRSSHRPLDMLRERATAEGITGGGLVSSNTTRFSSIYLSLASVLRNYLPLKSVVHAGGVDKPGVAAIIEDEQHFWPVLKVRRDVKHVAQGLNRQMPRFSWCLVRVLLRSEKCFWPDA